MTSNFLRTKPEIKDLFSEEGKIIEVEEAFKVWEETSEAEEDLKT